MGAKSAILDTETELMGGLPANLLATEEGDQAETVCSSILRIT